MGDGGGADVDARAGDFNNKIIEAVVRVTNPAFLIACFRVIFISEIVSFVIFFFISQFLMFLISC